MSIKISKVPERDTRYRDSLFDILVPDEDRHVMKLNPGTTFQLSDDHRQEPTLFTKHEVNNLQVRVRSTDYRIQSRAVEGIGGRRYVWVSFEPGWEPEPRNRKKAQS